MKPDYFISMLFWIVVGMLGGMLFRLIYHFMEGLMNQWPSEFF